MEQQSSLIQGDVIFSQNETILLKTTTQLNSIILTDGIATLTNGYLSNLITPTSASLPSTVVDKQYIDTQYDININTVNVPNYALIFNNGINSFAGSSNLTFTTSGLVINGTIVSGPSSLSGSTLTGLINPTTDSGALTKNYVDTFLNKAINQISSSAGATYTAAQVVNGVIIREGLIVPTNSNTGLIDISVRNIDTFPTGTQIINQLVALGINPIIGTTFTFNIINVNANGSVSLLIQVPDSSVSFFPVENTIFGSYEMSCRGIVMNVTTPTILMVVDSCSYVGQQLINYGVITPNWSLLTNGNNEGITSSNIFRTNIQAILPMSPVTYPSSKSVTYSFTDIASKLIIRGLNLISNVTDTFDPATTILSNSFFYNVPNGLGTEFAIQNVSPTYSITLSNSVGVTINGTNIIPAGNTGIYNMTINNNLIVMYCLGILTRM